MTRYADPYTCPDCRGPIAYGTSRCTACGLSLDGPVATELFRTLSHADALLARLRAVEPAAAPAVVTPGSAAPSLPAALSARRGLSAASVPKILLALGAVCLLVAALVFLAVSWSAMGVSGRTATLVAFTLLGGALTIGMARRGLRAATESLGLVTLGLLTFDLAGARDAGWFGAVGTPGFLIGLGAVLAVAAVAGVLAVRRTPAADLTTGQVVAVLGVAALVAGLLSGAWFPVSAELTLAVVLTAGLTIAAHRARLLVTTAGTAVLTGTAWLALALTALVRALTHPTARELWLDLEVWQLLVAAALVAAPAAFGRVPVAARVTGVAVAELLLTTAVVVPFLRGSATEATVATAAALLVTCAVLWAARGAWAWAPTLAAAVAGAWCVLVGFLLAQHAAGRALEAGAQLWAGSAGGRLPAQAVGLPAPWLLPVVVAVVVVAVVVSARALPALDRWLAPATDLTLLAALGATALVGTVAAYPVPVWLVVLLLAVPAVALTGWALARSARLPLALGVVFAGSALVVGLYAEWLTLGALLVTLGLAGIVHLRREQGAVSAGAGTVAVVSLAALVWTGGALAEVEGTWVALVGLLVLAATALGAAYLPRAWWSSASPALSRLGVELGAVVTAAPLAAAGVGAAAYSEQATWTAVYLTVTGAALGIAALLQPGRARLGWAGGLLLAAASWVRLADVGVETPEAYTLPSAAALLAVGVLHLVRHPASSSMTALVPGLTLALAPSLLWALWEPVSLRAVLLGVSCLALVLAGLRLRWTALVVVPAAAGAALVLRHAAPFIGDAVPRWVLIGVAGAVLVATGVTWERRIQEARAVVGFVRALR